MYRLKLLDLIFILPLHVICLTVWKQVILFNLLNKFAKIQMRSAFVPFYGENIQWSEHKVQFEMSKFAKLVHKTFKVGVRLHLKIKHGIKIRN